MHCTGTLVEVSGRECFSSVLIRVWMTFSSLSAILFVGASLEILPRVEDGEGKTTCGIISIAHPLIRGTICDWAAAAGGSLPAWRVQHES